MHNSILGYTSKRKKWWVGTYGQTISGYQLCSYLYIWPNQDTAQINEDEQVDTVLEQVVKLIDIGTQEHLRRSRTYSEQLAHAYTLDDKVIRAVGYGALLHDIGKIAINTAILQKPGSLTPAERVAMQRHPEFGAQLIAHMPFANVVAPMILGHHEYWDGGGYPQGLVGENIPIGARIISIVDAYDAMTTNRPYRTALHPSEAMQILENGRGTQFDPTLTDMFLELMAVRLDLNDQLI
jgi:putative two-component system response regulator